MLKYNLYKIKIIISYFLNGYALLSHLQCIVLIIFFSLFNEGTQKHQIYFPITLIFKIGCIVIARFILY